MFTSVEGEEEGRARDHTRDDGDERGAPFSADQTHFLTPAAPSARLYVRPSTSPGIIEQGVKK